MALCGNESERAHIPPSKKEICGTTKSYHSLHDKQRTRHNIDRPFLQIFWISMIQSLIQFGGVKRLVKKSQFATTGKFKE